MKIHQFAFGALALAAIAAALGLSARDAGPVSAEPIAFAAPIADQHFTLDPVHSSVVFRIEHNGVSNFYGTFNDVSGTYTLGDAPSLNIAIKTESVNSRNGGRDRHLKSPDFFNAAEFPSIVFKSTKVEGSGDKLKVTGDLTMHGVTKPVTADLKVWPAKETRQGLRSGFETTFTIMRSDFGMNTYIAEGGLGDEVTVMFGAEGEAK